jgi:hypothetical protein
MGESQATVECTTHGAQPEAFLCKHLMGTLDTGTAIGFHWSSASTSETPDAWCNTCEEARVKAGGEWTEEAMETVGVKLICATCYRRAKRIWLDARTADGLGAL